VEPEALGGVGRSRWAGRVRGAGGDRDPFGAGRGLQRPQPVRLREAHVLAESVEMGPARCRSSGETTRAHATGDGDLRDQEGGRRRREERERQSAQE